jgi:hypothetical protein
MARILEKNRSVRLRFPLTMMMDEGSEVHTPQFRRRTKMSRKTCLSVLFVAACLMARGQAKAQEFVHGHYRHSHYHLGASYVRPHFRTYADGSFYNNWST